MNRRGFFAALAASAIVAAVDMTRLGKTLKDVMPKPGASSHPLFSGQMGSYEGITFKQIQRVKGTLSGMHVPDHDGYYLIAVSPTMARRLRENFPGVAVRVQPKVPRMPAWS